MKTAEFGSARQVKLYGRGSAAVPVQVEELKRRAYAAMSPTARAYAASGAGGGATLRANLAAFDNWRIVPRLLRNVAERDLGVDLFGARLAAPVILGPVGVQSLIHPEGELPAARAAGTRNLPFVLSTVSSQSLETVAAAAPTCMRWYQLYWGRNPELTCSFLERAASAGYSVVVVTLDTPMLGWRELDLDHGDLPFLRGEGLANFFTDPVFCSALPRSPLDDPRGAARAWSAVFSNPTLTWKELGWLRRQTRLPIVLKGIQHREDARLALDAGVDGLIVSNHGGRQVDGAIASLDALPAVLEETAGRVPVLFDSGIRRGADAFKALALGAEAVLLGRLYLWGLALGGETGVGEVLDNFCADLDLTLALSGYCRPGELTPDALTRR